MMDLGLMVVSIMLVERLAERESQHYSYIQCNAFTLIMAKKLQTFFHIIYINNLGSNNTTIKRLFEPNHASL